MEGMDCVLHENPKIKKGEREKWKRKRKEMGDERK
jgi:hypothetical protein